MPPEEEVLEKLISKYLDGTCTQEEKETLFSWIEQLEIVKDPVVSIESGLLLKERIDQVNGLKNERQQFKLWRPLMAAASIVVAFLLMVFYYTNSSKPLIHDQVQTKKHEITFYNITNLGKKPHLLKLEDGSTVLLESKAKLLREVPFNPRNRKVELLGKAFFQIAKNKKWPFEVFSGTLSTTALGTSFWVDQNIKTGSIQVKLLTGKVVIRDNRLKHQRILGYLTPGQQLSYDITKGTFVFGNLAKERTKILNPESQITLAPLTFSHTPLNEVLNQLQDYYKVKIQYKPEDVQSMMIYGNYSIQDDIETILKTITASNGLTLTKVENGFLISR